MRKEGNQSPFAVSEREELLEKLPAHVHLKFNAALNAAFDCGRYDTGEDDEDYEAVYQRSVKAEIALLKVLLEQPSEPSASGQTSNTAPPICGKDMGDGHQCGSPPGHPEPCGTITIYDVCPKCGSSDFATELRGDRLADAIEEHLCRSCGHEWRDMCSDCPPEGYPTDETRCAPCPRRKATAAERTGTEE